MLELSQKLLNSTNLLRLRNLYLLKTSNQIKQLVATNCSKERPDSIVTETLKKQNFDTNSYIKRIVFLR